MYFLGIGIVLLLLKVFEVGPVAALGWTIVLSPFGLAALWWAWADWSGYSSKKAMDKMEKRKQDRIDKQRAAMGQPPRRRG